MMKLKGSWIEKYVTWVLLGVPYKDDIQLDGSGGRGRSLYIHQEDNKKGMHIKLYYI
jgi:hypothetical protein